MKAISLISALFLATFIYGQSEFDRKYDIVSSSGFDSPSHFIKTSDNGYAFVVTGSASGMQVVKTDSTGDVEWNKSYSGSYYFGSITEKSTGGYWIATSNSDSIFNLVRMIISLDDLGNVEWMSGDENIGNFSSGVKVIELSNSILLVGNRIDSTDNFRKFTVSSYDFNGNVQWQKQYNDSLDIETRDAIRTEPNGIVIAGIGWYYSSANFLKIDTLGNVLWHYAYTDSLYSGAEPLKISQASNGDILVAGRKTWLTWDMMAMRLDANGNLIWSKQYVNNIDDDEAYSIHELSDGSLVLCVEPESYFGYSSETGILKLDSNGNSDYLRLIQPSSNSFPFGSILNSDGSLTILGIQGSWGVDSAEVSMMRTNAFLETTCPYMDTTIQDSIFNLFDLQFSGVNSFTAQSPYSSVEENLIIKGSVLCSGIGYSENAIQEIKIYPNPANEFILFDVVADRIAIFDQMGRIILDQSNAQQIDVSKMSRGVYVVKVELGEQEFSALLVLD